MPNDAKLGMVVGLCLVIVVAVVFFGKELAGTAASDQAAVATHSPAASSSPRNSLSPIPAKPTSRTETDEVPAP